MNNPLVTLRWIWQYSLVLFIFTKYASGLRGRYFLYSILILVELYIGHAIHFEIYYCATMTIGMLLCDLMYNPQGTGWLRKLNRYVSSSMLLVALFLLSIPVCTPEHGMYRTIAGNGIDHVAYWILGWALLIPSIANSASIRKLLENKLFQWIARVSFAYYAIHWAFAISFTSIAALILYRLLNFSWALSAGISIAVSVPLILGISYFVEFYIYRPSVALCQKFANRIGIQI